MATPLPVVNLCVLRLPLKRADDKSSPFAQSSLDALGVTSEKKPDLDAFFASLQEQRTLLLTLLGNEATPESEVDSALTSYLSRLNHLLVSDAPLRHGISFVWEDALCSTRTVVAKSVEYEIVNTLLATALWKMNQGAVTMVYSETGLTTSSAARAFLLYRKAIGMVEYCERFMRECEKGRETERTDADLSVLRPLVHLLYAEIQGITVLRAIEKGNAPSLISSLALDAEWRYDQCNEELGKGSVEGSFLEKVSAYAAYKAACFKSYAYMYFGWAKLSGSAGGAAVRLTTEAEKIYQQATELGITYDKTPPSTNSTERNTFHSTLQMAVTKVKKQAESDNRHVYYERVPGDVPELPQPKQLIGSLVYEFPEPSPFVDRDIFMGAKMSPSVDTSVETVIEIVPGTGQSKPGLEGKENKDQEKQKSERGSVWWKWLLVFISIPLLLVATLLGIGVWIILIPFKFFCWPIGFLAQFLWNIVEYLIKAPLRAMLWASGAEWRPAQTMTETPAQEGP